MNGTKSDEMAMIFRQLTPANQQYFLLMVYATEMSEWNTRKVSRCYNNIPYWEFRKDEQL